MDFTEVNAAFAELAVELYSIASWVGSGCGHISRLAQAIAIATGLDKSA